jgi:hypothetical protein
VIQLSADAAIQDQAYLTTHIIQEKI